MPDCLQPPASSRKALLWIGCLALINLGGEAVEVPKLFQDHMVLQREMPVALWGSGEPGEHIAITFGTQQAKAAVRPDRSWSTTLPAMPADHQPRDLLIVGSSTITIHDVLVGEVWLCSGQSNMVTRVTEIPQEMADHEIPLADYPEIRYFHAENPLAQEPQRDFVKASWSICTPATVGNFSGVAYFFGRELYRSLHVPIGLVHVAVGGTACEAWTSPAGLAHDPAYIKTLKPLWEKRFAEYPEAKKKYDEVTLPRWQEAKTKAEAAGQKSPGKPGEPPYIGRRSPSTLFSAFIAPLAGISVRGVAWYQGESNADHLLDAQQYRTIFPSMIADWRAHWQRPDLPFIFVQIANFKAVQTEPAEMEAPWPFAREAQAMALSLPHTGMVTAIDINQEPENIHPKNKRDIGMRLGLKCLNMIYGKDIPCAGPTFVSATREGSTMRLRFTHIDGGLHIGEREPSPQLNGFAIAGEDGKYAWATAVIDHDTIVASNPAIPEPKHVRYDWAQNPIGNLCNGAHLPAFPFRTDTDQGLILP